MGCTGTQMKRLIFFKSEYVWGKLSWLTFCNPGLLQRHFKSLDYDSIPNKCTVIHSFKCLRIGLCTPAMTCLFGWSATSWASELWQTLMCNQGVTVVVLWWSRSPPSHTFKRKEYRNWNWNRPNRLSPPLWVFQHRKRGSWDRQCFTLSRCSNKHEESLSSSSLCHQATNMSAGFNVSLRVSLRVSVFILWLTTSMNLYIVGLKRTTQRFVTRQTRNGR